MFCLDFACAFAVHGLLASRFSDRTQCEPAFAFGSGALAGGVAAVLLYPFDVVRMSTVARGTSHFALSTIPFMSVYLGVYFSQPRLERRAKPLRVKAGWALASTAAAAAAELPFDRAKIAMAGDSLRPSRGGVGAAGAAGRRAAARVRPDPQQQLRAAQGCGLELELLPTSM